MTAASILDAGARVAPGTVRAALRSVPVVPRALAAPQRPTAGHLRADAGDRTPVDLALVAVAAADSWATGAGLPRPRPYLASRLLAACKRVASRHCILVTAAHHARARRVLTTLADAVNAAPADARAAVLCATLLDLVNDRDAPGFGAVSDELARIDRECPRPAGVDIEAEASRIADAVRTAFGCAAEIAAEVMRDGQP